jgi:signal transduction histidine kinase
MLDHFGLAVALREYCAEFTRKEGIPVNYVHRGISTRLPGHTAATLYRIAEEALANVAKHAHANQAWVTLSRTAKGIRLAIHDDGAGFDPAAIQPGPGLGMLAMQERLRAVQGSLSIRSLPGAGTEVVALAPLSSAGNQPCAAIPRNVVVDPFDQH